MDKSKGKIKPWKDELPSTEEWVKLGKPELWKMQDEYKGYKLYADHAFGKLALTTWGTQRIIVSKGKDFVANEDLTVIGLADYYLGDLGCKLFIRASDCK